MKLEEQSIDLHKRFREETRELPGSITLRGNPMLQAIATNLLQAHAPHIQVGRGTAVQLMSMESFCCAVMASLLEERDPPALPLLLHTIPEQELYAFAQKNNIPVISEQPDDVRSMLDTLANTQPQTYLSMTRSAQRLLPQLQVLRKEQDK